MTRALGACLIALCLSSAGVAAAQVAPNASWRMLRTPHFRVSFARELEPTARRAAVAAESAYARLAERLRPPRGTIDLVVSDDVDFSNGYTTPVPTNRIIIYTLPPLDVPSLRYYDDWIELVITHELTHVFHLDRANGWWGVAQHILGRAPFLFPNLYQPGWIIEGLATYYESAITGTGRVEGSYERMVVDASVMHGGLLPYGDWNLATTRYPYGDIAYGHGSLFFDFLARTHGDSTIARFIDGSSSATLPFTENRVAKGAFGISFADAWRAWSDTLHAHVDSPRAPLAGWRDLTTPGRLTSFPRWADDSSLVYASAPGDVTTGAYRVTRDGAGQRLGRRNDVEINTPASGGALVYSQLEFVDPYRVRADLYRDEGGHTTRLTSEARLAQPDVRADGRIVAVRYAPGTTQLVLARADGRGVAPLTGAAADTEWAEPRWSPAGDRIAVTRWTRGAYADVVILDTLGVVRRVITHDRAFDSSPSWTPDGKAVLFASDRTGVADVYLAPVDSAGPPIRLSHTVTALFYPAVSPSGTELAAARWDVDGWHVGVAPLDVTTADTPVVADVFADTTLPPAASLDGPVQGYTAWPTLLPHYWVPLIIGSNTGGLAFGAFTSGRDAVGRNTYAAQLLIAPENWELSGTLSWVYSGFGQPLIGVQFAQSWDQFLLSGDSGTLRRRTQTADLVFTFQRPRARTNSFLSIGGELESRRYDTQPDSALSHLDPYYSSTPTYWSLIASAGWTNAQLPPLAISPENGVSLGVAGAVRWLDAAGESRSQNVAVSVAAYQAINAGEFAHQVLSGRLAVGVAGGVDPSTFSVGGTSGSSAVLVPGLIVGTQRTFPVRGFPSGVEQGIYAATGSLEYRVPISQLSRGPGFWPVFLDRISVSAFGDAGASWTPGDGTGATLSSSLIASAGAEASLNLGVLYDNPYIFRLGLAVPVVNRSGQDVAPVSVYVQLGYSF